MQMMHPLVNSTSSPRQPMRLALSAENQSWEVKVGRRPMFFFGQAGVRRLKAYRVIKVVSLLLFLI
jgi:hypothetical protein